PANNDSGNFGCDGYPSVDQQTGNVFETSGCTVNNTPSLCLNIGVPDSSGNLCFLDDPASIMINGVAHTCMSGGGNYIGNSLITVASGLAGDPDLLFTVSSMDSGRNLHVTYIVNSGTDFTKYQAFTTVSSPNSNWTVWATPVQLSDSSTLNVFPWMVAGGPGRSDSVWYSTTSQTDPSVNSNQVWNVYMNQVVWPVDSNNHVTGAAPTSMSLVKVSPHPNHYNSICLAGTGCIAQQGDRNLADFFTVYLDHNGAADVEYNDTSNGLIQTGFTPVSGLADHPGAPVVTIAHQNSGPGLFGTTVSDLPNEPGIAPVSGMTDPSGDALYPLVGGTNQPAFDLLGNNLSYDGSGHLVVTMKVTDLTPATMLTDQGNVIGSATAQYVTRWQMGNVIYYAMAETNAAARQNNGAGDMFYAGPAQSIDLCSVSACDPHVTQYPEVAPNTHNETGSITCPATPSTSTPCTITVTVNLADVGSPSTTSLLEEVGSYAFGAARQQSLETNANAEADQLPLEIDGICCFNFAGSPGSPVPEVPFAPGLIVAGGVLLAVATIRNRRRTAAAH
ncbi:MAG: hypothetical protein JO198_10455, partial [Candidatus Dormibacteraeota bacterium]|nr:hypothetical protein [Candidatus Dormibacteraeota bacterium]